MRARITFLLLAVIVAMGTMAGAQERFGMLRGRVTDQIGRAHV